MEFIAHIARTNPQLADDLIRLLNETVIARADRLTFQRTTKGDGQEKPTDNHQTSKEEQP